MRKYVDIGADIFCRYRAEMDTVMAQWKHLGNTLADNAQRVQELMAKLMQFEERQIAQIKESILREEETARGLTSSLLSTHPPQNDVKTLKKWMADVDVFLNEEWPALGDSEALEKQLEQCTVRGFYIDIKQGN